uniref:Aldolase n=1 Tax=Heligmosomoides polygyrus TaxID=6339 RepID=A0A183GDY2_HELPZ
LTGGFRTARAMVDAVTDGTTDGIGLGRPTTAEPDLPAKILRGECLSVPDAKLDQDDYMLTSTASNAQMWQMGKRSFAELKNVCDDIADLSDPKEAENFKKAAATYYKEMKETAERNEAIHGVLMYKNVA